MQRFWGMFAGVSCRLFAWLRHGSRQAAPGVQLMLWRSPLRADCTAVLGPRSCRRTRYVRCAHCTQTAAASQSTKRAARADLGPALLVATEIAARRVPPVAHAPIRLFDEKAKACQQRCVWAGWSAPLERREAQGSWPRAQRASITDSSRLFECSARSERSEFCDGATRPSIAGKSARSADRSSEARRPAHTRLLPPPPIRARAEVRPQTEPDPQPSQQSQSPAHWCSHPRCSA